VLPSLSFLCFVLEYEGEKKDIEEKERERRRKERRKERRSTFFLFV
jgi:hypothetical protein